MKLVAYLLAVLGCVLAVPSPQIIEPILVPQVDPMKTGEPSTDQVGPRIIGGQEVQANSVPYQVAVLINGERLCGGSLISTTTVLTAAHCTVPASFVQLRFGAHYVSQNEPLQVRVTSANLINHQGYNDLTLENDISAVVLPSAVTLSDVIQVIPLAPSSAPGFSDSEAYLTGWGVADNFQLSPFLRGVNVNIISNAQCSSFFSIVRDSTLCTSGVSSAGLVGACTSDSGGPLVVDGVQVGVVSFGSPNCAGGFPTGFARVSAFRQWIETNTGV